MPQHDIEIEIGKNGEVTVHVKGVKGKGCLVYAEWLAEVVGKMQSQKLTSEYYEKDQPVRFDVHQRQGRG